MLTVAWVPHGQQTAACPHGRTPLTTTQAPCASHGRTAGTAPSRARGRGRRPARPQEPPGDGLMGAGDGLRLTVLRRVGTGLNELRDQGLPGTPRSPESRAAVPPRGPHCWTRQAAKAGKQAWTARPRWEPATRLPARRGPLPCCPFPPLSEVSRPNKAAAPAALLAANEGPPRCQGCDGNSQQPSSPRAGPPGSAPNNQGKHSGAAASPAFHGGLRPGRPQPRHSRAPGSSPQPHMSPQPCRVTQATALGTVARALHKTRSSEPPWDGPTAARF